ncbi:MAG TPA: DUF3987 domain-containing protein [Syntrophorhabdus sp.]|nr:DUF3987 domain-containing protein [Syntrophorhabdus sp.]
MNSTIKRLKEVLPSISKIVPELRQKTLNELAGPCPWCGGDDRFVVFKDSDRFLCRGCKPEGGDVIDFYRQSEGLDISALGRKYLVDGQATGTTTAAQRKVTGRYDYHDRAGNLLYWKERVEPGKDGRAKDFYFHHSSGENGRGSSPVLYNLPDVIRAKAVIITEGEKHADLLKSWGLAATSLDSGAQSKPTPEMIEQLSSKRIAILQDNDAPGLSYALTLAKALHGRCDSLKVVLLPGLPDKGDVLDWIQNPGNDKTNLLEIIKNAPEWEPGTNQSEEFQGEDDAQSWPEPLLFGEIETPEIPCTLLPGYLGEYCRAVTDSAQTPQGLAVMFGLATVAACLQKRFEVCPFGDDYTEPLSLWTVTALDPGTRKTKVKNDITAPLVEWEQEKAREMEKDIKRVKTKRDINFKQIEQIKNKAAKPEASDLDKEGYLNDIMRIERDTPDEIHTPRIFSDDVTPERLQGLLSDNGERMALLSDEGGVFEVMAGLYNNGRVNMNVFLQGHAGSPVRVDRQGRTVVLDKPALTFGLAVQPEVISDLAEGSKSRFRGNGTLARFLYCIPKSTVGHRDISRRVVIPESIRAEYHAGIMSLLNIEPVFDEKGKERPRILTLSKDARDAWIQFSQYIESKQGPQGEFYTIQDWTSKLPGAALRIAGLLHVVEHGTGIPTIEGKTIEPALDICDLLIKHAQAAFDLMGEDPASTDAKVVLEWIVSQGKFSFTQNEAIRGIRRFRYIERLEKALKVLTARHIISEPMRKNTGGRPSISYTVNPEIETLHRGQKG